MKSRKLQLVENVNKTERWERHAEFRETRLDDEERYMLLTVSWRIISSEMQRRVVC
jgi:hypothetical protein